MKGLGEVLAAEFNEWLFRMHGVTSSCDHSAEAAAMEAAVLDWVRERLAGAREGAEFRIHKMEAVHADPSVAQYADAALAAVTEALGVTAPPVATGLLDELVSLRSWKAEALPVISGLQDLGRALGMRPGTSITGPAAVQAAEALRAKVARGAEG